MISAYAKIEIVPSFIHMQIFYTNKAPRRIWLSELERFFRKTKKVYLVNKICI